MQDQILKIVEEIFTDLKPEIFYKKQIKIVDDYLLVKDKKFSLNIKGNIFLLAMGKAAAYEAKAIKEIFESSEYKIENALVVTKYDHSIKELNFKTIEAAHPILDESSLKAGEESLNFIKNIKEDDFLIFCLSGGASSLVESFQGELDFNFIQKLNKKLLKSGIGIEDFNLIRKSISKIKNGGLFNKLKSHSVSLITCDIPSGNLHSVSSSPSLYQEIDEQKLNSLLNKYLSIEEVETLQKNIKYEENKYSKGVAIKIADANYLATLSKEKLNFTSPLDPFDCEFEVGINKILNELKTTDKLITTGEMNVKVSGDGLGGRNTHFVLEMANQLFYENVLKLKQDQLKQLFILSVGTDGSDGPTDAAGAYFSYNEYTKVGHELIKLELKKFDSYNFFNDLGTLIKTGPTGTNLMDLRIIYYENVTSNH